MTLTCSIAARLLFSYQVPMKQLFGKPRMKRDGTESKLVDVPPVHELHTNELYRPTWVDYSALDAQATWQLREALYRWGPLGLGALCRSCF